MQQNTFAGQNLGETITLIKRGEMSSPIFALHGEELARETVLRFAEVLNSEAAVYSVAPQWDARDPRYTIEGVANFLLRRIQAFHSAGSCSLLGFSWCSVVAYELCKQLLGSCENISFLGLILPLHNPEIEPRDSKYTQTSLHNSGFRAKYDGSSISDASPSPQATNWPGNWKRLIRHAIGNYIPQHVSIPVYLYSSKDNFTCDIIPARSDLPVEILTSAREILGSNKTLPPHFWQPLFDNMSRHISTSPRHVEESNEIEEDSAIVLRHASVHPKQTLLCIPGAGNGVTSFLPIVEHIPHSIEVYGIKHRGLDGYWVPHASVSVAAEIYYQEISKLCPTRPLHIIGHSFGGWLAHALAMRLTMAQRKIASLTLIDSEPPLSIIEPASEYFHFAAMDALVEVLEEELGRSLALPKDAFTSGSFQSQLALLHRRMVENGLLPKRSNALILRGPVSTFMAAIRMDYRVTAQYEGPVRLIVATESKSNRETKETKDRSISSDWSTSCPNLTVLNTPGNHITMLKPPNAAKLAHLLNFD